MLCWHPHQGVPGPLSRCTQTRPVSAAGRGGEFVGLGVHRLLCQHRPVGRLPGADPVQGALLTRPRPKGTPHKGIFWAGIGGGSRIGGPDLCVAGPKVAGATVTGNLGAEGPRVGGRAGGAGRAVRKSGPGVGRSHTQAPTVTRAAWWAGHNSG